MVFVLASFNATAQENIVIDGQISFISSYSPDNDLPGFVGGRYIPEMSYGINLDTSGVKKIDFEASINISGSALFSSFENSVTDGNIQPYRIWGRYTTKQFELRIGLQKIDFGSATLLRPIQWFNQIDPRDPLQLTNGVYGVLGRYYFLNNTNIWLWGLIGNERTRGFDIVQTNNKIPEFGGRFQLPSKYGEIALSYHYRNANSTQLTFLPQIEKIPEHRIALDGKWDLKLGVWFEAALIHKTEDLGTFTNQALFNFGTDYTFAVGNGLNVIVEHLFTASDESILGFDNSGHITGATISYPIGLFDNLSSVYLYNWNTKDLILNFIYNHEFQHVSGYLMAYYNPSSTIGFQENDLVNQFSGPGLRLMFVYNH
jgi:hypothetical protein